MRPRPCAVDTKRAVQEYRHDDQLHNLRPVHRSGDRRFASIYCSLEIFIHAIDADGVIILDASSGALSVDTVFKKLLIANRYARMSPPDNPRRKQ
jgi:hypothetical protein